MSAQVQREPELPVSERLRRPARQVEQLATSGRTDPEQIVVAKLSIARALRRMAREMELAP